MFSRRIDGKNVTGLKKFLAASVEGEATYRCGSHECRILSWDVALWYTGAKISSHQEDVFTNEAWK